MIKVKNITKKYLPQIRARAPGGHSGMLVYTCVNKKTNRKGSLFADEYEAGVLRLGVWKCWFWRKTGIFIFSKFRGSNLMWNSTKSLWMFSWRKLVFVYGVFLKPMFMYMCSPIYLSDPCPPRAWAPPPVRNRLGYTIWNPYTSVWNYVLSTFHRRVLISNGFSPMHTSTWNLISFQLCFFQTFGNFAITRKLIFFS